MPIKIGNIDLNNIGEIKVGDTNIVEVYVGQTKIWPSLSHIWNYTVTNNDSSATLYLEWRASSVVKFQVAQTGIGTKSGALPQEIIDQINSGQIDYYWYYVRNNPTPGYMSLNGSGPSTLNVSPNSTVAWGNSINLPLPPTRSTSLVYHPDQPIV